MKIRFGSLLLGAALIGSLAFVGCESNSKDPRAKDRAALSQAGQDEADFDRAVDRGPTPRTLYAMSRILAAQHRDGECQRLLSQIIAESPNFMPAYNDLAELQMRQRRIDQAVSVLQAGLKRASNQPVLLNNLGMCNLLKGNYDEALKQFTAAAALVPDDSRFRANMATALGMLGRYEESLALYQQICAAADAHYNVAVLAEARHDSARATVEYDLAKNMEAAAEAKSGAN